MGFFIRNSLHMGLFLTTILVDGYFFENFLINRPHNDNPGQKTEIFLCFKSTNSCTWVKDFLIFMQMGSKFLNTPSYEWVLFSKSRFRSNHVDNEVPPPGLLASSVLHMSELMSALDRQLSQKFKARSRLFSKIVLPTLLRWTWLEFRCFVGSILVFYKNA